MRPSWVSGLLAGSMAAAGLHWPAVSLSAQSLCNNEPISPEFREKVGLSKARGEGLLVAHDAGTACTLKPHRYHVDEFGQMHVRFGQFYQGIRVWGAEAITHMNPDRSFEAETLALQFAGLPPLTPALEVKEALSIAHGDLSPAGAYAKEPEAELVLYPETVRIFHRYNTQGKISPNALEGEDRLAALRLAYHIHLELENAQDGLVRRDYMIDASQGQVLSCWSSLQTQGPSTGVGHSQFHGKVSINTWHNGKMYEIQDRVRASRKHPRFDLSGNLVGNLNGMTSGTISSFNSEKDEWGDGKNYSGGDTSGPNGQTAAVDVAFGIQVNWDMYQYVLGRNGIDGQGSALLACVHYGKDLANAHWDSSSFLACFGDGNQDCLTHTSMDFVGHELGHGICGSTADLVYQSESGGLNEANSDIFGTMGEFYGGAEGYPKKAKSIPDQGGNWTIGEKLQKVPIRFMYKPSLDGMSPDAWCPEVKRLDPHFASGPMNRAFYFLSQGADRTGPASAPAYLPEGMAGIGSSNALRIWYRALSCYMTTNSNYIEARRACLRAAKDLSSFQHFKGQVITQSMALEAVQNAFAGIAVGWDAQHSQSDSEAPVASGLQITGSKEMIRFQVQAKDNVQVTLVEFWVDDLLAGVGREELPGQYCFNFDSTQVKNGLHQIVIKAYDAAGNVGYCSKAGEPAQFKVENLRNPILCDGGFELPSGYWNFINVRHCPEKEVKNGKVSLLLGGFGKHFPNPGSINRYNSFLRQTIDGLKNIKDKKVELKCWVWTSSGKSEKKATDFLVLVLDEKRIGEVSNLDVSEGYQLKCFGIDPALLEGENKHDLTFITFEADGEPTCWRLDDVSITVD